MGDVLVERLVGEVLGEDFENLVFDCSIKERERVDRKKTSRGTRPFSGVGRGDVSARIS